MIISPQIISAQMVKVIRFVSHKIFYSFLLQKMKSNNNTIMHKNSVIIGLTKDFREIIKTYCFKYKRTVLKDLRFRLRSDEKDAYDENEDNIEYLQDIIDRLTKLKKHYFKQNKYHDHINKYHGIETIKYLFNDEDEDENLHLINNQ